jgi:hypothetical protein
MAYTEVRCWDILNADGGGVVKSRAPLTTKPPLPFPATPTRGFRYLCACGKSVGCGGREDGIGVGLREHVGKLALEGQVVELHAVNDRMVRHLASCVCEV